MKMFSGRNAHRPLSPAKAWTCLLINALVCPGVGSLIARRLSGWPQLGLALGGAFWVAIAILRYFTAYLQLLQAPPDSPTYWHRGLMGAGLLLGAWVWSIATGLALLREAKRAADTQLILPGF